MKVFLIDNKRCTGCHGCQVGCKDEHCYNDWSPYAKPQPEIGQFWLKLNQYERGAVPHVKVSFVPLLCQHCDNAPCMKAAPDAITKRPDGLVLLDSEKAKGNKKLADACPYGAIYWNEEEQIPQKCTGCAHLLDRGWPINVPRCVDNCALDILQFVEESEADLTGYEVLHPEYGTKPRVYYRGLPKKFIAGTVYDPVEKEIIKGATVTLKVKKEDEDEEYGTFDTFTASTDHYGDFWLRDLPDDDFTLTISYFGKTKVMDVSTKEKDIGLGDIPLS